MWFESFLRAVYQFLLTSDYLYAAATLGVMLTPGLLGMVVFVEMSAINYLFFPSRVSEHDLVHGCPRWWVCGGKRKRMENLPLLGCLFSLLPCKYNCLACLPPVQGRETLQQVKEKGGKSFLKLLFCLQVRDKSKIECPKQHIPLGKLWRLW